MVMHSLYKVSQFRHYIIWYIKSRIQHKTNSQDFYKKNVATKKRTTLIVKDNINNWI